MLYFFEYLKGLPLVDGHLFRVPAPGLSELVCNPPKRLCLTVEYLYCNALSDFGGGLCYLECLEAEGSRRNGNFGRPVVATFLPLPPDEGAELARQKLEVCQDLELSANKHNLNSLHFVLSNASGLRIDLRGVKVAFKLAVSVVSPAFARADFFPK